MKRLWINADDFGLTPAVSGGICEAILDGLVNSTTAMVCAAVPGSCDEEDADLAATVARFAPRIRGRIGMHLQLTDGVPRSPAGEISSLVDEAGHFPRKRRALKRIDPDHVEREWEAQLADLRALGIEPCHLDSHHHVHQHPTVFPVYTELARRHGLPARAGTPRLAERLRRAGVPTADAFTADLWRGEMTADRLVEIVCAAARGVPDGGVLELMSHPGRVDETLRRRSTYVEERPAELAVFCDPRLPERLREEGIVPATGPLGTRE